MRTSDVYRQMVSDRKKGIEASAQEFLRELGEDRTVQENTLRQFKFRLLNGNYRSARERELLLKVVDNLKKILES